MSKLDRKTGIISPLPQTKLGLWMSWLRSLGGTYEILTVEKSTKTHMSNELLPRYELDPKKYQTDRNGVVRRISQRGLEIAEKLGI